MERNTPDWACRAGKSLWSRVMSRNLGLIAAGLGLAIGAYGLAQFPSVEAPQASPPKQAPTRADERSTTAMLSPTSVTLPAKVVSGGAPMEPGIVQPPKRVIVAELPERIAVSRPLEARIAPDKQWLAREIQRHLKRVGCYAGDTHGQWSPSLRRAMKTFLDDVNASLPVDEPHLALLAMVESQSRAVCGAPCVNGFVRAANDRCRQLQATAHAENAAESGRVAVAVPLEGRMALAGPDAAALDSLAKQVRISKHPQRRKRTRPEPKDRNPLAWAFSTWPP
jgi:hypothetical protein